MLYVYMLYMYMLDMYRWLLTFLRMETMGFKPQLVLDTSTGGYGAKIGKSGQ
jgi:hypothetical protein